jgi:hypothetical protein
VAIKDTIPNRGSSSKSWGRIFGSRRSFNTTFWLAPCKLEEGCGFPDRKIAEVWKLGLTLFQDKLPQAGGIQGARISADTFDY